MKNNSVRPSDDIENVMHIYGNILFRMCLIMLGNASDAEDVVQETMIKYLQKAPKFENAEHKKAWLIKVAVNQCKDILRLRSKHPVINVEEIKEFVKEDSDSEIMEEKILVKKINEIEMPEEMRKRILKNCQIEVERKIMNKNKVVKFSKKSIVAVASLVLCVCLTGVTALAATGKLQGFFKDIMRWDGAVIGTEYEQATDEIELHIAEVTDELIVEVNMINPDVAPYSAFELFGIESYKIIDLNGKEIVEGDTTEMVGIHNGKANIHVSLENISNGEYKIVVSEFVGSAKADQPLVLSGEWECEFEK